MSNQELLKAYSAYLPYEVKVMFEGEELEHSLVGLDTTSTPLKLISSYGDYGQASFEFSKLVLRPLSDLTKEIEHNGEKFVPIKEIGDKYFGNLERYECDGEISYGWDEQGFDDAQGYQFSFCEESMVFGVWYDTKEEGDAPIYSVGGYNDIVKLFEWHFDVFGLIDKGLALNLNDLKDE